MARTPTTDLLEGFPREVSVAQLSVFLGINERNTRALITRKIAVRGKTKSKWLLLETLHNYHASLRASATGRADGSDGKTLASSRANLADLQAQEVQLRIARARGEFVSLADVSEGWAKVAQIVRSEALAMPSRLGFAIPHLTPFDRSRVGELMREMLTSISEEVASLGVMGSPGGEEFVKEQPAKARPKPVEVKIPSRAGRPRGT
ncbi:MAG: hypothetical protein O9972_39620 [Burkholderiales bacterium]|nr:hypothetical protein [Burkholderiales bacterium]